ncbi:MAG: amidohydrolase family protein [Pseudomonadota bacterium]
MDLREKIRDMKIVDHHVHALDSFYWMESIGSYPFAPFIAKLPVPDPLAMLTRSRRMLKSYREVYGFPYSEFTQENIKELDDLYQASLKDEGTFYMKAMDVSGIESVLSMCMSRPVLGPGLDPARVARAQLIDGFIAPLDNSGIGDDPRTKMFVKMMEVYPKGILQKLYPKSFDDYVNMITVALEEMAKDGVIAIKSNHPYWRDIAIDAVDKKDAEDVYNKKDATPVRYKMLQDYLMRHLIAKAGELDLPLHVHTGGHGIAQPVHLAEPTRFDPFLWLPDIKPAKIVLLHGGFPYLREAGFMASRMGGPNVYLDISLITLGLPGTPGTIAKILRDWLEAGLAPKMLYGSDGPSIFLLSISSINIREELHLALKGMIDDGLINEDQAFTMAQMILHDNAKKLYNNKI